MSLFTKFFLNLNLFIEKSFVNTNDQVQIFVNYNLQVIHVFWLKNKSTSLKVKIYI